MTPFVMSFVINRTNKVLFIIILQREKVPILHTICNEKYNECIQFYARLQQDINVLQVQSV